MSIVIGQSAYAVGPGIKASFLASGGTGPYVYSLSTVNAAGGSINSSSGAYTAPAVWNENPKNTYDTIIATDSLGATAEVRIEVGNAIKLFMEIIRREMGLAEDRVRLYQQKIFEPSDDGLWIAVMVSRAKAFGNSNKFNPATQKSDQYVSMQASLEVSVYSRSTAALWRKEDVLIALASDYSKYQQNANSFSIGTLPAGGHMTNLGVIDGAAIPYNFRIPINIQYAYPKRSDVPYFDEFQQTQIITDS